MQCFPVCGIALWYSFTPSVSQASPGNTENLVLSKDIIQLSTSYQCDINASAVNPTSQKIEILVLFRFKGAFWDLFSDWFLNLWYKPFTHEEPGTIHGVSEPLAQ